LTRGGASLEKAFAHPAIQHEWVRLLREADDDRVQAGLEK